MQQEMVEGGYRVGPEDIFDRLPVFERDQVPGASGGIVCIPCQIGKQCCVQVTVQEGLRKEERYQFKASISGIDCLLLGARGEQVECVVAGSGWGILVIKDCRNFSDNNRSLLCSRRW